MLTYKLLKNIMLFYYHKLVPTEIKKFWYYSQVKDVFSRK